MTNFDGREQLSDELLCQNAVVTARALAIPTLHTCVVFSACQRDYGMSLYLVWFQYCLCNNYPRYIKVDIGILNQQGATMGHKAQA